MAASFEDVLASAKSMVTALNRVSQSIVNFYGEQATNHVAANTLLATGSGRVISVYVLTAGAAGTIHDASSITQASSSNQIGVIPAAVGLVTFNWPFVSGLVYKPGASQVANISFTSYAPQPT